MNAAITIANDNGPLIPWDGAQIRVLRDELFKDLNDTQFALFAQVCKRTGLDPFSKQIYGIIRAGRLTIQTSIDGYRLIAQRTGRYDGQAPPEWYDGEKWHDVWMNPEPPKAAKIGVYIKGANHPTWAVANWDEYAGDVTKASGKMWKDKPALMLAKCAEALALRKAFPAELSGIYTPEEMQKPDAPEASSLSAEEKAHVVEWAEKAGFTRAQALKRCERMTSDDVDSFVATCKAKIEEPEPIDVDGVEDESDD